MKRGAWPRGLLERRARHGLMHGEASIRVTPFAIAHELFTQGAHMTTMSASLEKPASTGLHREEHGPRHSPELNPEVRLHADLEPAQGKLVPVRTQARLRDAANACMPGWSAGLHTRMHAADFRIFAAHPRLETSPGRVHRMKLLHEAAWDALRNPTPRRGPEPWCPGPCLRPRGAIPGPVPPPANSA